MLYGNFPFHADTVEEVERIILIGKYELPKDISPEARDLVIRMLDSNPNTRININEIYKHLWMQNIDYSCIFYANIVCLFTDEEITSMKQQYDFRERLNNSSLCNNTSVFTVHHLDTTKNDEVGSDLSKSIILDPFNTNNPHPDEYIKEIRPLVISKRIIKFSSKLREVDRQYESDNNSNIDNGIYVNMAPTASKAYSLRSTVANTLQVCSKIDEKMLDEMKLMGFDKNFVLSSLNSNIYNCATTCYCLLTEQ